MPDHHIHCSSVDGRLWPSDWTQKSQGEPTGACSCSSPEAACLSTKVRAHRLQQFAMAFNLSEKVILLQQPYFIKAFRERPDDPSQSRFGPSFTAVMERSHVSWPATSKAIRCLCVQMIIQIVSSILASHPVVASRVPLYWVGWVSPIDSASPYLTNLEHTVSPLLIDQSRTFAAVVCLKILIFRVPTSPLCPAAMQSITTALSAFQACTSHHPSKEILRRLSGLTKIHQRV